MKRNFSILMPILFGAIAAEYIGPQNGNGNRNGNGNGHGNGHGNGNGNGNAYGVPDTFNPQPSGPYPPSGWKPAGRRLLLPGESRGTQQPIDSGYGQPPPQYGPVNPSNEYGPVDQTPPPTNQYIPGTGSGFGNGNGGNGHSNGFGNGNNNGNGHGNGFSNGNNNGNGHGNGFGNGHGNGNGFSNGNGHKNGNGNGNGHGNGNGFSNGNGHQNGNGNGHGVNGNGNGNGFVNGNGNGNGVNGGNGFGSGNGNGNGHANGNGHGNGNGNGKGGNGVNGHGPSFFSGFPSTGSGFVYPFVQVSVPATFAAVGHGNGAGTGVYPIFGVPNAHPGSGVIATSFPSSSGSLFPVTSFQAGSPDLGVAHPSVAVTGTQDVAASHPVVFGHGSGLLGNGFGQYYTLLSSGHSHKSNIVGLHNGLNSLQVQYAVGHSSYGNGGVPLRVF